ncbi:uncharacterized protein Z520_09989 [Fonsecaea multimorphosa CBS 102226]|uniref:CWF21 domain-containing protein n=1 Tax=Fonsecaea multimorphosa CBS 102226 TaxID=1442371 RepID=A0A0D2JUS5_9EURO|nr:uncharacterized protein Z520_09989 [Fonsecaea multimorphosa CBS 102226]KIX94279.1 hypothetical protein Z520_09989 [Fonsecaea multimorphosa CBS 102226]OAL19960.1 hypothetical protein AYO22_09487 [Fonsecaea multimorphosa]
MSSNVGLSTPRGSGTSGYVQRNLSLLKPRAVGVGAPYSLDSSARQQPPKTRKPDQEILNHDRLRAIEVKVLELREKLEDDELDEDQIDEECEKLREQLTKEMEREKNRDRGRSGGGSSTRRADGKGLKSYQVHELAEAKEQESERLRRALGLKPGEIPQDDEHPMARQEKRRREREEAQEKTENVK